MRSLLGILAPRARWQLLALLLCSLLSGLLELVGVGSIMPFMAAASAPQAVPTTALPAWLSADHRSLMIFWGLVVLGSLGLVNLLTAATIALGCRFGNAQQNYLASRLLLGYLRLPIEWHFSRHTADLAESLQRARFLSDSLFRPLVTLLARGTVSFILVATLLLVDPLVTSVVLLVVAVLFGAVYLYCRQRLRGVALAESKAGFRLARTVQDTLGGLKLVQMRGTEGRFVQAYGEQLAKLGDFSQQRIWISEAPRMVLHFLANAVILLLVIYLEATLKDPATLIPKVSLYALAGYRLLPGLQLTLSCLLALQSAAPVLEALWADFRQLPPELYEANQAPVPLTAQSSIRLNRVSYRYPNAAEPVLSDVQLEIPVGGKVAIVGPSGRGKTTLLQILAGLLQPSSGQLEVDGVPLQPSQLRSWRAGIGYVPQEVFLLDASLLENLVLDPQATPCRQRAAEVLKMCAMEDFVPLMDEPMGERGLRLSGGQRQRLGVARALYGQPHLLILDESTNSLDLETESRLLAELPKTLTIVLVAHRPSAVAFCAEVVQL